MFPFINLGGMEIRTYSLFLTIGIGSCLMIFLIKNTLFPLKIYELIESIPFALGFAVLGGKLLSLLTLLPQVIFKHKIEIKEVFFSIGFVFYGALIGLVVGLLIESRRKKKALLSYTDTFFRLLPFGQAIGRIGCYFNGCCYGVETNAWFSIPYLVNSKSAAVVPTQFIESAFCLVLGVVLLLWQVKIKGFYSAVYLLSYGFFRFVLEFFRGDEIRGKWFAFSPSQWISGCLVIGCIILIYFNFRTKTRSSV